MARNNLPNIALSNYYRIKGALSELRRLPPKSKVCNICFQVECVQNHPKVDFIQPVGITTAEELLLYWLEIAEMESKPATIIVDDLVIPRWPTALGRRERAVDYVVYPALELPLTVLHRQTGGQIFAFYENGDPNHAAETFAQTVALADGSHWGYWVDGQFYFLRAFRNGSWVDLQRVFSKLPDLIDLRAEDPISKLHNGFWYVPIIERYDLFADYLFRV